MPLRIIVRRFDWRGVLEERCVQLVRLAALEPIEIIEPFSAGPTIVGTTGTKLVVGCVMPLTESGCSVLIALENLRDAGVFFGPLAVVAGEAGRQLSDTTIVDRVVVPPGE